MAARASAAAAEDALRALAETSPRDYLRREAGRPILDLLYARCLDAGLVDRPADDSVRRLYAILTVATRSGMGALVLDYIAEVRSSAGGRGRAGGNDRSKRGARGERAVTERGTGRELRRGRGLAADGGAAREREADGGAPGKDAPPQRRLRPARNALRNLDRRSSTGPRRKRPLPSRSRSGAPVPIFGSQRSPKRSSPLPSPLPHRPQKVCSDPSISSADPVEAFMLDGECVRSWALSELERCEADLVSLLRSVGRPDRGSGAAGAASRVVVAAGVLELVFRGLAPVPPAVPREAPGSLGSSPEADRAANASLCARAVRWVVDALPGGWEPVGAGRFRSAPEWRAACSRRRELGFDRLGELLASLRVSHGVQDALYPPGDHPDAFLRPVLLSGLAGGAAERLSALLYYLADAGAAPPAALSRRMGCVKRAKTVPEKGADEMGVRGTATRGQARDRHPGPWGLHRAASETAPNEHGARRGRDMGRSRGSGDGRGAQRE